MKHNSQNDEDTSQRDPAMIAKAGRAPRKTSRPKSRVRRIGFMAGQISVPEDFDQMGQKRIERIFDDGA